jgi:hypothetical protein
MAKQQETTKTPKAPKIKRINRSDAANSVVAGTEGKATLSELASKADALFIERGGKANIRSATWYVRRALETAEAMGVVKLVRPTDLYVERVKK